MSLGYIDSSAFTNIADAIRQKKGTANLMSPSEMPNEIATIPTGGGDLYEILRPIDWLPMPADENVNDNEFWYLFHLDDDYNFKMKIATQNGQGSITIEIGTMVNGTFTPDSSKTLHPTNNVEFSIPFNKNDWGNTTTDGYTQCVMKISSTGNIENLYYLGMTTALESFPIVEIKWKASGIRVYSFVNTPFRNVVFYTQLGDHSLSTIGSHFSGFYKLKLIRRFSLKNQSSLQSICSQNYNLIQANFVDANTSSNNHSTLFSTTYSMESLPSYETSILGTEISYSGIRELHSGSYKMQGNGNFRECYFLRSIPDTLDWREITDMTRTFYSCYNLKKLHLNLRDCTNIPTNAFQNCYSLSHLTFDQNTGWVGCNFTLNQCAFDEQGYVEMFNSLPTITNGSTITIRNSVPARNLTADQRAIATNKGWNLSIS